MDLREYKQAKQSRHPWELARAGFVRSLLLPLKPGLRVLDVGSGDAWLAEQLLWHTGRIESITCWDAHYQERDLKALQGARDNRLHLTATLPNEKFDAILLCDVLEHVEHDQPFLQNLVQNHLKTGGQVIITVPEWQFLFTAHDTALGHFRRYRPRQMRALLQAAGLTPGEHGQLFFLGFLVRLLEKLGERLHNKTQQAAVGGWDKGPRLTRLVTAALTWDAYVTARAWCLPGLTWWGVCQKRSS